MEVKTKLTEKEIETINVLVQCIKLDLKWYSENHNLDTNIYDTLIGYSNNILRIMNDTQIERKKSLEIRLDYLKFQLTTDNSMKEDVWYDLQTEIEQIEEELETLY
jgi:hypothetical protein